MRFGARSCGAAGFSPPGSRDDVGGLTPAAPQDPRYFNPSATYKSDSVRSALYAYAFPSRVMRTGAMR